MVSLPPTVPLAPAPLPPGACDCHFHLFGPQARFPLKPHRHLVFEDCTLDDLMAMHDKLGISRGLIVQSFQKVAPLHALAPNQTELPFMAAQLASLAAVIVIGTLGVRRFRAQPV